MVLKECVTDPNTNADDSRLSNLAAKFEETVYQNAPNKVLQKHSLQIDITFITFGKYYFHQNSLLFLRTRILRILQRKCIISRLNHLLLVITEEVYKKKCLFSINFQSFSLLFLFFYFNF